MATLMTTVILVVTLIYVYFSMAPLGLDLILSSNVYYLTLIFDLESP